MNASTAHETVNLRVYTNFGQIESVSPTKRLLWEVIVENLLNGIVQIYNAIYAKVFFVDDMHKELDNIV